MNYEEGVNEINLELNQTGISNENKFDSLIVQQQVEENKKSEVTVVVLTKSNFFDELKANPELKEEVLDRVKNHGYLYIVPDEDNYGIIVWKNQLYSIGNSSPIEKRVIIRLGLLKPTPCCFGIFTNSVAIVTFPQDTGVKGLRENLSAIVY